MRYSPLFTAASHHRGKIWARDKRVGSGLFLFLQMCSSEYFDLSVSASLPQRHTWPQGMAEATLERYRHCYLATSETWL